jgi:hypothetical protein
MNTENENVTSLVYSEYEMREMNSLRENYELLSERDKFILYQALKPYFDKVNKRT